MPRRIIYTNDEHSIQVACVEWFRYSYPMLSKRLFAVPNGGRRDAVTGAKMKAEGVIAGVADLILLVPCKGYGALLIEMKTAKGRQSQAQKQWQKDITAKDEYRYVVCHSFDDFRKAVKEYLCHGNE
jgi:hypothetical protein